MEIIFIIVIILIIYFGLSFWHFIKIIGDKYRKSTWVDYIAYPAVMIIVYVFLFIKLFFKEK